MKKIISYDPTPAKWLQLRIWDWENKLGSLPTVQPLNGLEHPFQPKTSQNQVGTEISKKKWKKVIREDPIFAVALFKT